MSDDPGCLYGPVFSKLQVHEYTRNSTLLKKQNISKNFFQK